MNPHSRYKHVAMLAKADFSLQSVALRRGVYAFCLVALVAIPVFQAFRGLDVTDQGFVLTNQRFVFTHPENVSYWFHLWLTNVVGGIVDLVFGRFGVLPHKLAGAVLFWVLAGSVFLLYRRSASRMVTLVAITVSMAFNFLTKTNIVHYNNLSAALYVLGAALLCEAALSRRSLLFALSGFVLALNVFARIPNLIGVGLFLALPLLNLFIREPERRIRIAGRDLLVFVLGAFAAAAAALAAMLLLGHLPYYLQSLRDLFGSQTIDAANYGLRSVIRRPVRDLLQSLAFGLPFALGLGLLSAILSLVNNRLIRTAGSLILPFLVYLVARRFLQINSLAPATAGICYWAILWTILDPRTSTALKLSAVLGACLSLAMSMGSDTGIRVSMYVFPAMFPALICASRAASGILARRLRANYKPLKALSVVITAVFLEVSVFIVQHGVYRDVDDLRWTVHVPQLANIFTSEARAKALEEDLPVISSYAPPGSELLAYDSICLIHFATRTLPYLSNPWPVQYKAAYIDALLRSRERRGPLPVVLLAKFNARGGGWPATTRPPANPGPVLAFLERNGYSLAWESSTFRLYTPGMKR